MGVFYWGKRGCENGGGGEPTPWQRPSDWIDLPAIVPVAGEAGDKFYGLFFVQPEYIDEIALKFRGAYHVDWGDGTSEDVNDNVQVEHQYDFASLPDENLTSEGYKQVIITVTPQSGQRLTELSLELTLNSGRKNNSFRDIRMSGDAFTDIRLCCQKLLENFEFIGNSSLTSISQMFYNCYNLQSVPQFDTSSVTTMQQMFYNCYNLQSVPQFDTSSVTTMYYMFGNCYNLQSVPQFDTSSVTTMQQMFYNCYNLQSVPQFDTSSVTTMQQMFYNCYNLQSVPQFDTSSVTTMYYMFGNCYNLQSVPQFDTSSVENFYLAFYNCRSIESITLNLASGTDNRRMLDSCSILESATLTNIKSSIGLTNTKLSKAAIVDIFTNGLIDLTGQASQSIDIRNTPGAPELTDDDIAIATNKNWTVVR